MEPAFATEVTREAQERIRFLLGLLLHPEDGMGDTLQVGVEPEDEIGVGAEAGRPGRGAVPMQFPARAFHRDGDRIVGRSEAESAPGHPVVESVAGRHGRFADRDRRNRGEENGKGEKDSVHDCNYTISVSCRSTTRTGSVRSVSRCGIIQLDFTRFLRAGLRETLVNIG